MRLPDIRSTKWRPSMYIVRRSVAEMVSVMRARHWHEVTCTSPQGPFTLTANHRRAAFPRRVNVATKGDGRQYYAISYTDMTAKSDKLEQILSIEVEEVQTLHVYVVQCADINHDQVSPTNDQVTSTIGTKSMSTRLPSELILGQVVLTPRRELEAGLRYIAIKYCQVRLDPTANMQTTHMLYNPCWLQMLQLQLVTFISPFSKTGCVNLKRNFLQ